MKFTFLDSRTDFTLVAPLVGARIEIPAPRAEESRTEVAPLVGARIEISGMRDAREGRSGRSPRGSED